MLDGKRMNQPRYVRHIADPMITGYFEAPPLTDRHTSILFEEAPELVDENGFLHEDIGIIWVKPFGDPEADADYFVYVGEDEVEDFDGREAD